MANETETVERLKNLGIQDLEQAWVDAVWNSDFTANPEIPDSINHLWSDRREVLSSLQDVIDSCTPWARLDFATPPQGFWNVLCEHSIIPRSLLAGLHHFMNRVDNLLSPAVDREIAVAAAHLYILLMEIPGSGAYRVQQPMLFEEALDTFKLWPKSETGKRKRQDSGRGRQAASSQPTSSQQQAKKTRRLNTGRTSRRTQEVQDEDEDEDGSEDEEVVAMTTQEVARIQKAILNALKEVVYLLRNVPLKSSEHIVEHVMMRLAEISRTPTEQDWNDELNVSLDHIDSTAQLAYMGLKALCSGSHGDVTHMLRMVFKHLLPNILMLIGENQSVAMATIPKHIQLMMAHAEAFASLMCGEIGEKSLPSIRVLLQHMCVKVPDKVEYRSRASHTVARILAGMPPEAEASFVQWLYLYSKNAKISYRVFALEVVGALLERPERHTTGEGGADQQQFLSHRFLLDIMISRCSDRAPTVRAKALSCFAKFTALANTGMKESVAGMLAAPTAKTGATPVLVLAQVAGQQEGSSNSDKTTQEGTKQDGTAAMDCGTAADNSGQRKDVSIEAASTVQSDAATSGEKKGATPGNLMGGSPALLLAEESGEGFVGNSGLLACLKQRVCDDKVGVRKAALQALENVFKLQCMTFDLQLLEILRDRCRDTALSVRKQALDSLTSLLEENPTNEKVQRVWLQGVLPVVSDRESSASEKCLQLLQGLILDGIASRAASEVKKQLAWNLLMQLMQPDLCDLRIYFQRVCRLWARQKLLSQKVVQGLAVHTEGQNAVAAWMFLAEVSNFCPHLNKDLVLQTWDRLTSDLVGAGSTDGELLSSVLSVMGSLAGNLTEDERERLIGQIRERLINVLDTPNLIGAMVETLYKLCCIGLPENQTTNPKLDDACDKILQSCDSYLSGIFLSEDAPKHDENMEEILIGRIFLLGEIAQLCPYRMPRRIFTLVQSLLAGPGTFSEGSELPSSQGLTQFSQQPLSQFRGNGTPISMAVRAHAFVTLGKLCLHHEGLAKQCIAALARELEIAEDPAVRNNVALVMCDLCIRYPNLVDRYIPNLATCLRDADKLVRKQTLTQLTQLVLEDYVKWRGPLFFRFVSVIVDEVETVRDFAEYCLVELLLKRHPGMLHQQFVEGVFHFNNYHNHAVFNQFTQSDRERELFSLEGQDNAEKRMKIYRFMLHHMTDEHRFKLTAKLSQEVLGAFVDGVMPLDKETSAILQDTLKILCCKEIKLASLHAKQTNTDDIVEEMQMAEAVMAQAKSKLISQVVKKNVIENIIPVVIALKHMLEKQHSPLLKDLMQFLKDLMKDYRNEVKDIFAADRQLASEIEFDLRKFDEQQAELARQAEVEAEQAKTTGTPGATKRASKPPTPRSAKTPVMLSPKAVAGCTPRIVRQSPRTPSTAPAGATKERLLAAQAIVNSARKAFASARRGNNPNPQTLGQSPQPNTRQTDDKTPKKTDEPMLEQTDKQTDKQTDSGEEPTKEITEHVRRVRMCDDVVAADRLRSPLKEVQEENTSKDSTVGIQRAISTPDKTIANITFHAPMDVSAISLSSPIPSSLPIRVYSQQDPRKIPGTKSWTPQLESEEEVKVKKENLVLMFSPEHPAPKPQVWNITSPQANLKRGGRRNRTDSPSNDAGTETRETEPRTRSGRIAKSGR